MQIKAPVLFGVLPSGKEVYSFFLSNANGLQIELINYGAVMRTCQLPTEDGHRDVVLGFDTLEKYLQSMEMENPPYFGCMVGRYAGRIRQGKVRFGDKEIQLTTNNGGHHLHGGFQSFSRAFWEVDEQTSANELTFRYVCPAGTENYPGELNVQVTYTLTDQNELKIAMRAVSTEDTIINLTQHHYWNLDGHASSVEGQSVFINSKRYLVKDAENIPTGKVQEWSKQPLLESLPHELLTGIDHSFVLEKSTGIQAKLMHPSNGWQMSVYSNQAAGHIFIGCGLPSHLSGKNGQTYHSKSGICFEMQNFPDAPNHAHFPSSYLEKDKMYENNTIFHFEKQTHV
ncbi:MAG: Aldose 1-epimerase precursor [Bacteroidota bacterium]|jgi:aldose 1-epimerase